MAVFDGFLFVKLENMGTKSETYSYFLQLRDNTELPVIKKSQYRDQILAGFESKKVTIEGRLGPNGIHYDTVTERTTTPTQPTTTGRDVATLARQAFGAEVVGLQIRLSELGFEVAADGFFGSKTAEMVRRFQAANNLTPDGIVGPETWAALRAASCS